MSIAPEKTPEQIAMRRARVLADMTKKEVAELLGVHPHTYAKWENDPEEMSISTARQFCRIVKQDFSNIFFEPMSN